jgi:hypothetical protein
MRSRVLVGGPFWAHERTPCRSGSLELKHETYQPLADVSAHVEALFCPRKTPAGESGCSFWAFRDLGGEAAAGPQKIRAGRPGSLRVSERGGQGSPDGLTRWSRAARPLDLDAQGRLSAAPPLLIALPLRSRA